MYSAGRMKSTLQPALLPLLRQRQAGARSPARLAEPIARTRASLWDLLSDEGRTVWVCGSMNVNYRKPLRGAVLPDPWAIDLVPQPRELGPYYSFTRRQVMEHTNPDAKLRPQDYLAFAQFM